MKLLIILLLVIIPSICIPKYRPLEAMPTREFITLYSQIFRANPTLQHHYTLRLTKAILNTSIKYNVKPNKLAAILAQESRYRLDTVNKLTKDYGIGQINIRTIKAFNLNKNQLLTDLEYSIDCSGMVLADFKRMYGKKEKNYYSRYNSSNPDNRKVYEQLVQRFM